MSLFFDAAWFDARLAAKGLSRASLAVAAGISLPEMGALFSNERAPNGAELAAFSQSLDADLVEVTLRGGVSSRESSGEACARIESIEARLDAMDAWLDAFEREARKRA